MTKERELATFFPSTISCQLLLVPNVQLFIGILGQETSEITRFKVSKFKTIVGDV